MNTTTWELHKHGANGARIDKRFHNGCTIFRIRSAASNDTFLVAVTATNNLVTKCASIGTAIKHAERHNW